MYPSPLGLRLSTDSPARPCLRTGDPADIANSNQGQDMYVANFSILQPDQNGKFHESASNWIGGARAPTEMDATPHQCAIEACAENLKNIWRNGGGGGWHSLERNFAGSPPVRIPRNGWKILNGIAHNMNSTCIHLKGWGPLRVTRFLGFRLSATHSNLTQ